MNLHSVLSFVDHASPQELTAMVKAKDPYSYMALAKLQELRDNSMRAKATQAPPPPMSQTIPQQLGVLERPQGLPSIPMQNAQQPAPSAPPAPPAPATTPVGMRSGGIVAFKHGGFAAGGQPDAPYDYSDYYDIPGRPLTDEQKRGSQTGIMGFINNPFGLRNDSAPAQPRSYQRSPAADAPTVVDPASAARFGPLGQVADAEDADPARRYQFAAPSSMPAAAAVAAKAPARGAGVPGMGNLDKRVNAAFAAKDDALKNSDAQIEAIGKASYDPARMATAQGDMMADMKKTAAALREQMPNHMKPVEEALKKYHGEVEADQAKAPYQGMLKMATALMASKSSNFLQALGEAGGQGLEEFNRINELNKTRKQKLLEADAHMAAAQNARDQGITHLALQQSALERAARMEAYHAETDAKVQEATLKFQTGLARANVPVEKAHLYTQMFTANAHMAAALKESKPEAVKVWEAVQRDPGFAKYVQSQRDADYAKSIIDNIVNASAKQEAAAAANMQPFDADAFFRKSFANAMGAYKGSQVTRPFPTQ